MPTETTNQPTQPPGTGAITIAWDELNTRKVDQRLREHEALERNRRQAEMNPLSVAVDPPTRRTSIWYHPVFALAVFGLLGGLLAWGGGELLRLRQDPKIEAQAHLKEVRDLTGRAAAGMDPDEANRGVAEITRDYADNPYFAVYTDATLTPEQRQERLKEVDDQQWLKSFIANLLSYGLSGMLIAACLSIAEPVVDRNRSAVLVNGFVGAALGLIGGLVVSLFVQKIYEALTAGITTADDAEASSRRIVAYAVSWGVLGLFLTLGPGIVMRNGKKLAIGLTGGFLGGILGGALFDPIYQASNDHVSRLVALCAIGLLAGAGTGLIEHAAKSGWLRVTAGLIAGKQFILYRNPTFIGAGPECPIYLFRDPAVGRRHAAVHLVPGGFELENLPLGGDTLVNDKPIDRVRLKAGDAIRIGATRFEFQEKNAQK